MQTDVSSYRGTVGCNDPCHRLECGLLEQPTPQWVPGNSAQRSGLRE